MKNKINPADIMAEYAKGVQYKQGLDLYETVRQNENFYIGRQWEGVNAPDLDKPVINILRRVVAYFLSTIVSDDVSANITDFGEREELKPMLTVASRELERIVELANIKNLNREVLRNAAVDGDGCLHFFFDPSLGPEEHTTGQIEAEIIDNTNVVFANPQVCDVQKQPYILIAFRRMVEEVREDAKQSGGNWQGVVADDDSNGINTESETGKVTVVRKYYKQDGTIWVTDVCAGAVVKPPVDLGYQRFPLCWLSWEKVKNSYHGQSSVTGMVPNQIFVNKLFAMGMQSVKQLSFPKVVYNKLLVPDGWDNRVGGAIPVMGNPAEAVATGYRAPDMSNQVLLMIEKVIQYTRDTMGASDAALGNVRPDNTSAIIAVQRASSMPLELQRMAFYQFVEDMMRVLLDMLSTNYGLREVVMPVGDGTDAPTLFDFGQLKGMHLKLNVEIGAATYWSELMQVQTIDNLFARGIIQDAEVYLECIPDGYIRNKGKIIAALRQKKQEMEQGAMGMQGGGLPPELAAMQGMQGAQGAMPSQSQAEGIPPELAMMAMQQAEDELAQEAAAAQMAKKGAK